MWLVENLWIFWNSSVKKCYVSSMPRLAGTESQTEICLLDWDRVLVQKQIQKMYTFLPKWGVTSDLQAFSPHNYKEKIESLYSKEALLV